MSHYLYLSVIPEALIVSMLPPEAFGHYFAVGTRERSRGQAIFFEIDPVFSDPWFDLDGARRRCVPHSDGRPRNSVYAGVYRALEHIPLAAFRSLHLATDDGRVLALEAADFETVKDGSVHLYQEFCPVTPRVASSLDPAVFARFLTASDGPVRVPRLVFCELELGELAGDPDGGRAPDLPYSNLDHLRDCLLELRAGAGKTSKIVIRNNSTQVQYRTVRDGFFVGDADGLLYYPMPGMEQLEGVHRQWWRSAQMTAVR
jgi:hypothetical protein